MKKLSYIAILIAFLCANSCSKDKYGNVSVQSRDLDGFYELYLSTNLYTLDSKGKLVQSGTFENNPGWNGSVTYYYDIKNGEAVEYAEISGVKDGDRVSYYLKREDGLSHFSFDANSREVSTDFQMYDGNMTLYSASDALVQILCESARDDKSGVTLYYLYELKRVEDGAVLQKFQDSMPLTEENIDMVKREFGAAGY